MLKQTLRFIFSSAHFFPYLTLFLILIILTLSGIFLFYFFLRTRNKLLLMGGGALTGVLGFLLSLFLLSYVLKPPFGITVIYIVFALFSFFLYYFAIGPQQLLTLFVFKVSPKNLFLILILLLYSLFIFLFVNGAGYAGDVSTYWSLSTSFARGNYPTFTPWQPNFLSGYHQGTIMMMGALHHLTGLSMVIIHYALSIYLCLILLCFVTGWMREYSRSNWSLLPAIFILINFGGPIFSFHPLSAVHFADLISYKGTTGSCGVWLGDFTFCNFRLFGFVTFLLFLYFYCRHSTSSLLNTGVLITLLFIILSIDESLTPICLVLMGVSFLVRHFRLFSLRNFLYESIILGSLALFLFLTIQNPIRDGLFNPKPEHPRFTLLKRETPEFTQRLKFISGGIYSTAIDSSPWYLMDIRFLLLFLFLFSFVYRSRTLFVLTSSALIVLCCSFLFYDYFWPANGRRMILTAYQLGMFGLGYLLLLLSKQRNISSTMVLLLLILVLAPQTIAAHLHIYNAIQKNTVSNLIFNYDYHDPILDDIARYVTARDRILFLDDYPYAANSSSLTTKALIDYGMLVPTAPRDIKITNVDGGPEWYDFMLSLNPRSVKELDPTLVYISSTRYLALPYSRKKQISSEFSRIYSGGQGTLYSVGRSYANLPDDENSFYSLMKSISQNSSVYVDLFDYPEIRRGLILRLSHTNLLYGPAYNYGGDFYMHLEYTPRFYALQNLQAALQNPTIKYLFLNPTSVTEQVREDFILKDKLRGVELWVRKN